MTGQEAVNVASESRGSQSKPRGSAPRGSAPSRPETPTSPKRPRHEDLLRRAGEEAKSSKWLESARSAGEALRLAQSARDFGCVGEAAERAREARKRLRQAALKVKGLAVIGTLEEIGVRVSEDGVASAKGLKGGCVVLEPPGCVGVDGRTLRELCERAGKPALIVVREPPTRAGLWPVVAVGPATVRARVAPPKGKAGLTPEWCAGAIEALAAAALESVDAATAAERVEALVARAESVPESEAIYEAIIEASAAAAREALDLAAAKAASARKKPAAVKSRGSDEDDEET